MKKIRIKKYLKYLTKSYTYLYLYFTLLACKDGNWKIVQDDTFVCLGWWNDNENNIDLIASDYKAGIFDFSGIGIGEYKSEKYTRDKLNWKKKIKVNNFTWLSVGGLLRTLKSDNICGGRFSLEIVYFIRRLETDVVYTWV